MRVRGVLYKTPCGYLRDLLITLTMQKETDATKIDEKFLDTGKLLGLEFNEGIIGAEVTSWKQHTFRGHTGLDRVAPGESTGFTRLEDGSGDDILYIERDKVKLFHLSIGHYPYTLHRFTNYPDGENRLRIHDNLGTPRPGDSYGYISGGDSPYNTPTEVEELVIPPDTHLTWNFYNDGDNEVQPVLNIKFREYEFRPLDPSDTEDKQQLKRIVSPGTPIPVFKAGNMRNQIRYELSEFWGVRPVGRSNVQQTGGIR